MPSLDAFSRLVAEFEERTLPEPTPRSVALARLTGKADALVGMRRVGKTWRLFQHIQERLAEGIPRHRLLYVNLEDDRLADASPELGPLLDAWWARYPDNVDEPCWLYLDEVQNAPGWERFVRRVLDRGQIAVALTGSSSRMLSAEIATSLRGRALATELLPFGFAESLAHRGTKLPSAWPPGPRQAARLRWAFSEHLETGGFPEVQELDAPLRRRVLQEYVDVAVLRDVVERHGVTQIPALRWLVRRLLAHPASRFTANKLHRDLKSQGHAIAKDTVHQLLGHIEDAHLVHTVARFTPSLAQQQTNPRKVYPVDPALARTAAFARADDVGHRLETLVYLELRRRGWQEVGYYETGEGEEVDFVGTDPAGTLHLVQVAADMSEPKTRRRELRALERAMAELDARTATVVTLDDEERWTLETGVIDLMPAWAWLLHPWVPS